MKTHPPGSSYKGLKGLVLTMGTFDGIHAGHQEILNHLVHSAREMGKESALLSFHPHPRLVLYPEQHDLQLLMDQDEMANALEATGLDHFIIYPFTKEFAQMSPEAYIRDFLVKNFSPARVVIGYNHRFGKDRSGDIRLLERKAEELGFEIEEIPRQMVEDLSVSSTKIRTALHEGQVDKATKLLGKPFSMSGKVVKGQQVGQEIGFPTANIILSDPDKLIPAKGVYAVRVTHHKETYGAMLNIGFRPTFEGQDLSVEVHLFDFDQQIYGDTLKIELIAMIRQEQKFESKDLLAEQLSKDKAQVISLLH